MGGVLPLAREPRCAHGRHPDAVKRVVPETLYYHGALPPGAQLPVSWYSLANTELPLCLLVRLSWAGFLEFRRLPG